MPCGKSPQKTTGVSMPLEKILDARSMEMFPTDTFVGEIIGNQYNLYLSKHKL